MLARGGERGSTSQRLEPCLQRELDPRQGGSAPPPVRREFLEIVSPLQQTQLLRAYSQTPLPKALPVSNSAKRGMGMRKSAVTQTVMAPDAILPHMVIEDSGLPNETSP